eukprot:Blabericola_migrator_1__3600@NODE_2072_length_3324_cov_139_459625_g1312_i0_p2_GENE_NODE_2072_length_3324_cov_139_459625_g1312_i0NODE_2072_length_3324_cov_139_459625_g1312_i0_p2_ORF_typecomplete_len187_score41_82Ocnus/PF05005_15/8_3e02Ocnus/PF05005_15/1_7e17_NODE_2072_length_3324_cov_139_459625_g1312_i05301090
MSVSSKCKLLRHIKGLNEELQRVDDPLSEKERKEKQAQLERLYAKYRSVYGVETEGGGPQSLEEKRKRLLLTPVAELDPGTHKFVLINVQLDDTIYHFVRAKTYAKYHYMAAEPLIEHLVHHVGIPYEDIEVVGGGRCRYDPDANEVFVYGYSNQFGQPPMGRVVETIGADPKYGDCHRSFSLDGY